MGKTLLLTGYPGIGKTTILRQATEQLGARVAGFYTQEIFGPGGRKGFTLITLEGQEVVLAHKDYRGPDYPRVGRYGVDVAALERVGVSALKRAMDAGKVMLVDEIGLMELFSREFRDTVMLAMMTRTPVLGSIMAKSHPEANVFKALAQTTLWEVNQRNRDELPDKIVAWINKEANQ